MPTPLRLQFSHPVVNDWAIERNLPMGRSRTASRSSGWRSSFERFHRRARLRYLGYNAPAQMLANHPGRNTFAGITCLKGDAIACNDRGPLPRRNLNRSTAAMRSPPLMKPLKACSGLASSAKQQCASSMSRAWRIVGATARLHPL